MNQQTQRLSFQGQAGRMEVLRDDPVGSPLGCAFVAHPHPLFGGSMDNKVVQTLARAHVQAGWTVFRFNFRGVGGSEGVHDAGLGECEDLLALIAQAAPQGDLALAGFSFGSFVVSQALNRLHGQREVRSLVFVGTAASRFAVADIPPDWAPRLLVLHGLDDDTVPLQSVLDWAKPQNLPVTVVPAGGHFFHGQLPQLRRWVHRHVQAMALEAAVAAPVS
jgi:alpha/beta superfamily hydrolase